MAPATAVVVALAAGLLVGCRAGDSNPSPGPTTRPSATTSTSTSTVDYHRVGPASTLTTGYLNRASPDGSVLFVEALDPALSSVGCEGQPEPVMFRVPLAGGPRESVMVDGLPIRGNVVRGPGHRVALVKGCEEFVSELRVGTEAADGSLHDLHLVALDRGRGSLGGFGWSADGSRLLAGRNDPARATPAMIVAIDPANGAVTNLFPADQAESKAITQMAQLPDGSYVEAGFGRVTLVDATGMAIARAKGIGFVLGDGPNVVVYGEGIILLSSGLPHTVVHQEAGVTVQAASLSPNGVVLVETIGPAGVESVAVTTLADDVTTTVAGPPGRYFRAIFTGDGRAIAFNRQPDPTADPTADPDLIVVPLGV